MDVASFCHGSEMADHEKNVRQVLEIFAPKISILSTLKEIKKIYVGPHTGTVPVLALGQKILPVVELGVFLPVVATIVEFFCRCHNGVKFCLR